MAFNKSIVCIHAHPDDEALFTSGVSAHYAELGFDVTLITCTNGSLGRDDKGREGNDPEHNTEWTIATRAHELEKAAKLAGFSRVFNLGYDDSGLPEWEQFSNPKAFVNADFEEASQKMGAIINEVQGTVLITYDENGFYGHPDHIMANRVTGRAAYLALCPQRIYYPVMPQRIMQEFLPAAKAKGLELPEWILRAVTDTPDDFVDTTMDVSKFAKVKQQAILTHASQIDNGDIANMDEELFMLLFGTEYYHRAWTRVPTVDDATDLFGGLPVD
jgi:LmbE family N-acetylglucosaminyl deacetylase